MSDSKVTIAGRRYTIRTGSLCTQFRSMDAAAEQIALLHDEIERLNKLLQPAMPDSDLDEGKPPETVNDYLYLLSHYAIDLLPDECDLSDKQLDEYAAWWEIAARPLLEELVGKKGA